MTTSTRLRVKRPSARGEVAAGERLVGITENSSICVSCSGDVFHREMDDAVERALYAFQVEDVVAHGRSGFALGDFMAGTAAARRAITERCAADGWDSLLGPLP